MAKNDTTDTTQGADTASAAPIQGVGMRDQMVQSGEGTTAAETGTDKPGPAPSSKKGGSTVRVKTPMTIHLNDEEVKKAAFPEPARGQPPVTSYSLVAGRNDNVPSVVADHWIVQGNLAENKED